MCTGRFQVAQLLAMPHDCKELQITLDSMTSEGPEAWNDEEDEQQVGFKKAGLRKYHLNDWKKTYQDKKLMELDTESMEQSTDKAGKDMITMGGADIKLEVINPEYIKLDLDRVVIKSALLAMGRLCADLKPIMAQLSINSKTECQDKAKSCKLCLTNLASKSEELELLLARIGAVAKDDADNIAKLLKDAAVAKEMGDNNVDAARQLKTKCKHLTDSL